MLRDWRSALALVHYFDSPVGPYNEYAVIELQLGGPSVTEMLVDSIESREAGRELWGFPKELADLQWQSGGTRIMFRRERKYFRFRALGFSIPFRLQASTKQTLDGQRVKVPFELAGEVGLGFRGRQLALVVPEFEMSVFPPEPDEPRR
jgi:hypothetical protein